MKKEIANRLNKISERDFNGNDSAMAREFDMTPQSIYRYMKGKRTPGAKFLILLAENGYNINWVLSGAADMHTAQPSVENFIQEKGVAKMLTLIIKRLAEVNYNEEVKMKILKETLNKIAIAQNDHFVETELNKN